MDELNDERLAILEQLAIGVDAVRTGRRGAGAATPAAGNVRPVNGLRPADPGDGRTLAEWGREVGASARTLARAFAADTGLPFGRFFAPLSAPPRRCR